MGVESPELIDLEPQPVVEGQGPGTGYQYEGVLLEEIGSGGGTGTWLPMDGQWTVAVAFENGRIELDLARRGVEALLPIGPQHPLLVLPLYVGVDDVADPHEVVEIQPQRRQPIIEITPVVLKGDLVVFDTLPPFCSRTFLTKSLAPSGEVLLKS